MGALTSGIGRRVTSNSAEHRHTSSANLGEWKGHYTLMSSHHEGWTPSSPFGLQAVQGSECVEQSHHSAPDHPCSRLRLSEHAVNADQQTLYL